MRYVSFLFFLSVCVALTASAGFSQTRSHPFTVHDLLAMERISNPQVSPDSKRIVFVLAKTDLEEDRSRTDLWMVRTDGKDLRQLTSHKERDSSPRWDPDGRTIWFLSSRSDSSQVWRIRIDGGEALQVTGIVPVRLRQIKKLMRNKRKKRPAGCPINFLFATGTGGRTAGVRTCSSSLPREARRST